ncbi:unnamed protein product [Rotaria sp. Silwood1]|nr:unnamed protein product [Rotaria sp. Silwood1]
MNLNENASDDLSLLLQQSAHNDFKLDELNDNITRLSVNQPTDDLNGDVQRQDTSSTNERCPEFRKNQIRIMQEKLGNMKQEINNLTLINSILYTQLMEQPATTDGLLIWLIPNIRKEIENALCLKELFLESPPVSTVMNGHRVRVYLYLNGKTSTIYSSSRYISIYIRLLTPIYQNLKGTITFCMVDQSNNCTPDHFQRTCPVDTMMPHELIGFDEFMPKKRLYQDPSRYIHDDEIRVIMKFNQTNAERFANHPQCVRNALENIT